MSGRVYLAGAGPGDPGLLTRRAAELLASVDVVVIDALVSAEIRAMIPAATEIVEAGKRASRHTLSQDEINALLVELGKSGRRVLRLKGGDPFVFGRGGEEAEAVAAAGIAFEIVPGISSAIAAPAYAGIPVTHRSFSTSFSVITAHESEESSGVDWGAVAAMPGTLIFLMGLRSVGSIAEKLIGHGKDRSTAVAVIASGTTPRQRTVSATLATIDDAVKAAALEAPALIVVGEVVTMRQSIAWFEKRPLFGRNIVVTRAREQASRLASLIEDAGGRALQYPMIEIAEPDDFGSLDLAIREINSFHWIIFSSTNGVDAFFKRLLDSGADARALSGARIAAVGTTTAAALAARSIRPEVLPDRFQSMALLEHLPQSLRESRVLVVRAARGNDDFLEQLHERGAEVVLAVAYQTRGLATDTATLASQLAAGEIDAVTFTSGSTVENFFEQLGSAVDLSRTVVASIGPQTSAALGRFGARADLEAAAADIDSLFESLLQRLARPAERL